VYFQQYDKRYLVNDVWKHIVADNTRNDFALAA